VSSLLLELPHILSIQLWTRFENLRDPFEEHEDKKIKPYKMVLFLRIRGASLKNTAKKITIKVPISKKTNASIV
jgi:hypothetical protein